MGRGRWTRFFGTTTVMPERSRARVAAGPARQRTRRRYWAGRLGAAVLLVGSTGGFAAFDWLRRHRPSEPDVVAIDVLARYVDGTPVTVTYRAGGERMRLDTTADEVRRNVTLWRRMDLADWNDVPSPVREQSLDGMMTRYRDVLWDPRTWDRMDSFAWDAIPQPMRTLAFREMVAYWSGYYDLGGSYGVPPRLMSDTLAAIVMSESWFNHRGQLVNRDGTVDLGLGGTSEFARERLRQLHRVGVADVDFPDEAYLNPWHATRFVAVWMSLMLDETEGDLDRAVRAYHRGLAGADDALGMAYGAMVRQRFTRFIRNHDAPPAWDYLWRRGRDLERREWPWMARPVTRPGSATTGQDRTAGSSSPAGAVLAAG